MDVIELGDVLGKPMHSMFLRYQCFWFTTCTYIEPLTCFNLIAIWKAPPHHNRWDWKWYNLDLIDTIYRLHLKVWFQFIMDMKKICRIMYWASLQCLWSLVPPSDLRPLYAWASALPEGKVGWDGRDCGGMLQPRFSKQCLAFKNSRF